MFKRHRFRSASALAAAFEAWLLAAGGAYAQPAPGPERAIQPVPKPVQGVPGPLGIQLIQVQSIIRGDAARSTFGVTGRGLTAAVLDTGLRVTHQDFQGAPPRVVAVRNFTQDDGGAPGNVTDLQGHGSNVCGIIAANSQVNVGIAPGANVIPLKVLDNGGGGSFQAVEEALDWVIANRAAHGISVVNLSLGDSGNHDSTDPFPTDAIRQKIRSLRNDRVAVVVAAGNDFSTHGSRQGMAFPGIIPEAVSVGAVFDADIGPVSYSSGAQANRTGVDLICPFSQRLFRDGDPPTGLTTGTDVFAPGAAVRSTGILADNGFSIAMHGTSQAAPAVAGLILLMQEYHRNLTSPSPGTPGELPTVDDLEVWLRRSGVPVVDGDDEDDNVTNTNKTFRRIDAVAALNAITAQLQNDLVTQAQPRVESISRSLKFQSLQPGSDPAHGAPR